MEALILTDFGQFSCLDIGLMGAPLPSALALVQVPLARSPAWPGGPCNRRPAPGLLERCGKAAAAGIRPGALLARKGQAQPCFCFTLAGVIPRPGP